ncbi:MAG TPA: DUF3267 domain-containing protein [Bacillaceae bacterium]
MHCWKTVGVDRKYFFFRNFFISAMVGLFVFILLYIPMQLLFHEPLEDRNFLMFFLILLMIYPLHKLLHVIPIMDFRKHFIWRVNRYFRILPVLSVKVMNPIPKGRYSIALLFPFLSISAILFAAIFLFPQYGHYITILFAYHTAICVNDLIYVKMLMSTPRNALVEENEEGYEILVKE